MSRLTPVLLMLASGAPSAAEERIGTCELAFTRVGSGEVVSRFTAEVVSRPASRARGLMGRTSLPPGQGMLFDFEHEGPVQMWMKNTRLALDMVFITSTGRIARIERGAVPFSELRISSGTPVRYVLEVTANEAAPLTAGTSGSELDPNQLRRCRAATAAVR